MFLDTLFLSQLFASLSNGLGNHCQARYSKMQIIALLPRFPEKIKNLTVKVRYFLFFRLKKGQIYASRDWVRQAIIPPECYFYQME